MTEDPKGGGDGDGLDVPQWVSASEPRARRGDRATGAPGAAQGDRTAAPSRSTAAPHEPTGPRRPNEPLPSPRPARPGDRGGPGDQGGPTDDGDDDGYGPFLDFDGADDRDYVRLPRRPGVIRRVLLGAGVAAVLVVLAVTAGGWWVLRQIDPPGPPGDALTVTIEAGSSAQEIAEQLEEVAVVGNARLFREYLRFRGAGDRAFQAGPYTFNRSSSMSEALAVLEQGPAPVALHNLTMPEGLRIEEIAQVMGNVAWFAPQDVDQALRGNVVRSPFQPPEITTLEGLVFPDTYEVAEGTTPVQAVQTAVDQLGVVAGELGLEARAAELGYTPYQILIIASLIEREARVPEDRAKIARVIYNRIGADMRLDIDATVVYALGGKTDPLTQSDLEIDSPYNTRRFPGLPPTPIAAPGRASIDAALNPEPGAWLYYVLADEDGHHYFTEDYDDFLGAVDEAYEKGLI